MNVIFLVVAFFLLLFTLNRVVGLEKEHPRSVPQEIKRNIKLLIWGVFLVSSLLGIPYQIWVLTGSFRGWAGVYVIGGTAVVTLAICFFYYYREKGRQLKVNKSNH